jgi:transcriptional regulator with XRE-family HTH domain
MTDQLPDPVMEAVRAAHARSNLSFEQLGLKMGYTRDTARKSAWQFVNRTNDPRFSMLRRFAEAVDIPLAELMEQDVPAK